jgi:hypothetical protein
VGALLQRRLQLHTLEVDGAEVPQLSVRGLGGDSRSPVDPAALPVARLVIKNLSWINRRGLALPYALEADFDPGWRPRVAQLRRPDAPTLTQLTLKRVAEQDRWETLLEVGGGTAPGQLALQTAQNGQLQLSGELAPQGIDVVAAMTAFKRRAFVGGQASGQTTLSAQGQTLGELASSLRTQTQFRMAPATLLRFDLDRAIKSLGSEHTGQTRLDALTGQLDTRNTPQGMLVRYTDVKASSGALSAAGEATLINRRIEGEFAVDLVDGLVGVPLTVSGTMDDAKFSVPKSAVAGAVAGTAVLPGIGTAIGARIGAAIGKLFGDDQGSAPAKPVKPAERASPATPGEEPIRH